MRNSPPCGGSGSGRTCRRSVDQPGDRCAEVRLQRVPELGDERMILQRLLHDAPLHALASTVNQAHLAKPRFVRGGDVLGDDRRDVARREGMEVERVFDWNLQDG